MTKKDIDLEAALKASEVKQGRAEKKGKKKRKRAWFEFDQREYDKLDEFDSGGWWKPTRVASTDYLSGMWERRGWKRASLVSERDTKVAHGMVQGFLDAFSREGRYVVAFDENMSSAGTDMRAKIVKLTTSPLIDETITAEQAGHILTALAVHEICHPRYGFNTAEAVERVFGRSVVARQISNLLDDVRIEHRFVEDFPGYTGLFAPLLKYIGDGLVKRNGGKVKPTIADQYNIAVSALRFPDHAEWSPEVEGERRWWRAWGERWAREDSPRRHVDAVREGLQHVVQVREDIDGGKASEDGTSSRSQPGESDRQGRSKEASEEDSQGGASNATEQGDFSLDDLDASVEASQGHAYDQSETRPVDPVFDVPFNADDEALGKSADAAVDSGDVRLPSCAGTKTVDGAAGANGVQPGDLSQAKEDAQEVVDDALFHEENERGESIDVVRSTRGLEHLKHVFRPSNEATRYVRDALLSSRTGHTATAHYRKRGRLDERALHRLATRDYRLFDKRSKPSPGKHLIWVLVDKSSSMDGAKIRDAAQVAHAVASASEHVPSMRVEVWAWSYNFRAGLSSMTNMTANRYSGAGAARAWTRGEDLDNIGKMIGLRSGGTPDSTILLWAGRAILSEVRGAERPVILMCSDGQGSSDMNSVVERVRQLGVKVVSVSLGASVSAQYQEDRYGEGNYVPWRGSIIETARPLARLLARIVGAPR